MRTCMFTQGALGVITRVSSCSKGLCVNSIRRIAIAKRRRGLSGIRHIRDLNNSSVLFPPIMSSQFRIQSDLLYTALRLVGFKEKRKRKKKGKDFFIVNIVLFRRIHTRVDREETSFSRPLD